MFASLDKPYFDTHGLEIDYSRIDPGVRKTVQWLRRNHYYTRSSGVVPADRTPEGVGEAHFIHIRLRHADELQKKVDRLVALLLEQHGTDRCFFSVVDLLDEGPWATWPVVRGLYEPHNEEGIITLIGIDDEFLGFAENVHVLPAKTKVL